MEKTVKLYDVDAYATQFEAVVISCEKKEKKNKTWYDVVLNQTLFFPEEGGQTPDRGKLNGIEVEDVQIREEVIYHTLLFPLEEGALVKGEIQWQHRFFNMQQHSGEHIFSGLVHRDFGYDNVGFHLSDQIVTMDFNGMLTDEDVEKLEWEVNEVIVRNVPIKAEYPTSDVLKQLEYRSKIEIEGDVRIVTIEEVDVCACCAPHVSKTGEIGGFKIMSRQNYKGGVRISFLCGFRALMDFREKSAVISQLVTLLSEKPENIVSAVEKLKEANQSLKYEVMNSKRQQMQEKIAGISSEEKHVLLFESELDATIMRDVVNQLTAEREGICGVFVGDDSEGYRFVMGSSSLDTREVLAKFKEIGEVRGGGSPAMVQGTMFIHRAEIQELTRDL